MKRTMILLCALAAAAFPQQEARRQIIYVQVRIREIVVNPNTVKPGPVTLLVDNQTMMTEPVVVLQLQGRSERTRFATPRKKQSGKRWYEGALAPGEYTVTLEQAPELQAPLMVKP